MQIFLLSSFQLTCAALLLGTYSVSMSFQSLSDQLCRNSFQTLSNQLCRSTFDSLIRQLDLVTSLSLALWLGSRSCKTQLQTKQLQQMTQKSFQLTQVQLCQNVAQGGVSTQSFPQDSFANQIFEKIFDNKILETKIFTHNFHNFIQQINNKELEENFAFICLVQLLDQQHLH